LDVSLLPRSVSASRSFFRSAAIQADVLKPGFNGARWQRYRLFSACKQGRFHPAVRCSAAFPPHPKEIVRFLEKMLSIRVIGIDGFLIRSLQRLRALYQQAQAHEE